MLGLIRALDERKPMPYNQFYGYPAYQPLMAAPNTYMSGANDILGVRWVSNIDEVKATSTPDGSIAMFMHSSQPYFYIKKGAEVSTFKFEKVEPPKPEDFVTRTEFEELRKQYESYIRAYPPTSATTIQQQSDQSTAIQPNTNNANGQELYGNTTASQATTMPANSGYGMDQGPAQSIS